MKLALTYDDIQLVPGYSEIASRQDISLETNITTNYSLKIPLVASPMDTVCGYEMAQAMMILGGAGVIHRFMSIKEQADIVKSLRALKMDTGLEGPVIAAVGANGDFFERAKALVDAGVNIILIDVAHGHHENVKYAIDAIKTAYPNVDIIAGNIATAQAAEDLQAWGADGLRVGIGGGSLCTTRVKTGFGIPNVTCLTDIQKSWINIPVMADGGIRSSGDIAKALALGADTVMLGSLLAGTKESPGTIIEKPSGLYKRYRGAASLETKMTHGQANRNVEGESTVIPFKGGVYYVVHGLLDGVRSALSYAGAASLEQYHPEIVQVTNAGLTEARPHLL